jgi:hypothetical protein
MKDQVTSECSSISFPVEYHDLHPDISINFQLNRFYGWVGDESMLTEMREAAASVREYPTFTRTFSISPTRRSPVARRSKALTTCAWPSSSCSPATHANCPHASASSI